MIYKTKARRAAVIGGDLIGLEAAENLRLLGLDVTIFEYDQHVFPLVDGDIAQVVDDELRKNGVRLMLSARVSNITSAIGAQPGEVFTDNADPVPADLVIVAVGVRAKTEIAQGAGLAVGGTGVTVNESMQTSDPDIYAVGDMVETPHLVAGKDLQLALAGPANRQGRLAADHIAGRGVMYRGNLQEA